MQANDPHILSAMEGRENGTERPKSTKREEPAAFFFVVFGLVYETLSTSSADSASTISTREPTLIAALHALKSLVRPEYSGMALVDSPTFDEFISLCYRMAMTESAGIQVHLVEMLTVLATSRSQAGNGRWVRSYIRNFC
jgi:hypothetical protein